VRRVRDDPERPDPGFAELYAALPFEVDLEPWLGLARKARPPVLYVGIGAGRLAVPLTEAGVQLVGVDSHPGMIEAAKLRLPGVRLLQARIEDLSIADRFELVMAPSHVLGVQARLRAAARLLAPRGSLALELINPHWLAAGAAPGLRVRPLDHEQAEIEVDYPTGHTHADRVNLVWPEEVDAWLLQAGLKLAWLGGGDRVASSPSFQLVARMGP